MPRMKPKVRGDLVVSDFGEELVVCKPTTGYSELHHLNQTATLVFRLCDGTGTSDDLVADIADAYGLPVAGVQRDVRTIVRQFRQRGLLTAKPVVRRPRPDTGHDHEHEHKHDHPQEAAEDERARIQDEEPGHD